MMTRIMKLESSSSGSSMLFWTYKLKTGYIILTSKCWSPSWWLSHRDSPTVGGINNNGAYSFVSKFTPWSAIKIYQRAANYNMPLRVMQRQLCIVELETFKVILIRMILKKAKLKNIWNMLHRMVITKPNKHFFTIAEKETVLEIFFVYRNKLSVLTKMASILMTFWLAYTFPEYPL